MQRVQLAISKLRRSKTRPEVETVSAKTGDGLEILKEVIAAGWLVKTGGKGHTVKNSKKRWFVLRGVFLSYYTEDPSKSVFKDREILKGQLYLVGAQVSDLNPASDSDPNTPNFTLKSRSGKEFVITAAKDVESLLPLDAWRRHLRTAINRATKKFSEDAFEGCWMYKKKYNTSWKRRWLLLRGNILSYFAEIPQKEDSIDGLKGSFDISDVSELTTDGFEAEDHPQIGKRKFVIRMVIDNVRYYLSAPDEETHQLWFDRLRKQMAKIATQYNVAARGVGVMKQYRKSMAVDHSNTLVSSSSSPNLRDSHDGSETDSMRPLKPLFKIFYAMGVKDDDIWEGKEWIYPVMRHFSTEVFAAAGTFAQNIISIFFPEDGPFGLPRKSYKIDKRTPVYRIVANIIRSLKLDPSVADPAAYTLQTFGGVFLNEQAPLAVYGLGSLLQNWQLKLVLKPKSATPKAAPAPAATGAAPAPPSGEFPILIVFDAPKFASKSLRVLLHPSSSIEKVISKLCEAQKVKHPNKFALQTIDNIFLHPKFNLESYGLGKRFNKWELKLVPASEATETPHLVGIKYAWVQVDESLSLAEAKSIISKLDQALAKTTASAKASLGQLQQVQEQLQLIQKKNTKLVRRLQKKQSALDELASEASHVRQLLVRQQTTLVPTLNLELNKVQSGQSSTLSARGSSVSRSATPRIPVAATGEEPTQSDARELPEAVQLPETAQSVESSQPVENQTEPLATENGEVPNVIPTEEPDAKPSDSIGSTTMDATQELSASNANTTEPAQEQVENADESIANSLYESFESAVARAVAHDDDDDDDDDDNEEGLSGKEVPSAVPLMTTLSVDIIDVEQRLAAEYAESLLSVKQQYEAELGKLREELESLRSSRPSSNPIESDAAHESDQESAVPAPPSPPPPPPLAPASPEPIERPKTERPKKDKREEDSPSAVDTKGAVGGIGVGVLEAISNKKFALKKVDPPTTKKKRGDDFLRDALEKRFVAMNLDDVEDLDTWDDDSSASAGKWDDSAWGDDVLHI